jgi:ADP-ribosylation factor 6
VGGQDKIRPLWRHYFSGPSFPPLLLLPSQLLTKIPGTQGLVFVVDSSDRDRIDEARTELTRIIQDREMKDALLLVFANKQDIPGALRPEEVSRLLRLNEVAKNHVWKVQPSCAKTGDGIFEGLVCYVFRS